MHFLKSLFSSSRQDASAIQRIHALRDEFSRLKDSELRAAAIRVKDLHPLIAITAVIVFRVLGLSLFDVQLRGALALARGSIAEMQTGEGKTVAAVPTIAGYARKGDGVHVMTVNDYLARRDSEWMGEVFRWLGLSVGHLEQTMSTEDRRAAYSRDVTYAAATEIGFDLLRDRLALRVEQQVQRPFAAAVIDEIDSILIDEARIPLVLAGGDSASDVRAHVADEIVRALRSSAHTTVDTGRHNVALTDAAS
jgi:preprotein translocase subunit SecA